MCNLLDMTFRPSGRIERCAACGDQLTIEMEFDQHLCCECQKDVAELHDGREAC